MTIRLVVADDLDAIRKLVRGILQGTEIEVVGEAPNGEVVVKLANSLTPDVVLLDVHMPICDGFEALKDLKTNQPKTAIVMHSSDESAECLRRSHELEANGFQPKSDFYLSLAATLRDAVRCGNAWTENQLQLIQNTNQGNRTDGVRGRDVGR